jgi:pimeloyl-ACP methyl ester carboxylesterase
MCDRWIKVARGNLHGLIGLTVRMFIAGCLALLFVAASAKATSERTTPVYYRAMKIDGLSIFYREAGPANAPTLLLLHGFPSSLRMYEPLFSRLAGQFHLIAPDYPGFGYRDAPDPQTFAYTFDHIADVVSHFTDAIGATHYILDLEDYGGSTGFRLALAHPERVSGLIIQNAVAHEHGLGSSGKRAGSSGGTVPRMKLRFRRCFFRSRPRENDTLVQARIFSATTLTSGQTNQARPRSRLT